MHLLIQPSNCTQAFTSEKLKLMVKDMYMNVHRRKAKILVQKREKFHVSQNKAVNVSKVI